MGLQNAALKDTPATEVIGWCLDSKVFDGSYNMRSDVGMLLYLTNTSYTDCAFAMNQCARFAYDPREPHQQSSQMTSRLLDQDEAWGNDYQTYI
jgi:hypothetical protein